MDFTNFLTNQQVIAKLIKNSFDQNRLFHTYLFNGPRGALKMDAAIYLASLVLCENHNACGQCENCRLINQLHNPHLFVISPDGETIKKEQIEDLEHEFGYRSDYPRVFIIQGIEKTTMTAANTLLKFLEELPDNCYGVLISENINRVLPTIRSRSQIVTFSPIHNEAILKELKNKGVEVEKANVISKLTNNTSNAMRYCKDKDVIRLIEYTKNISTCIEENRNPYLEYCQFSQTILSMDRDKNKMFVDLLVMIQNDKINFLINRADKMLFTSLEYTNILQTKDIELKIIEVLLEHREHLDTNVNVDMQFTEMFLKIGRLLQV